MKRKLYTKKSGVELLKQIDNGGQQFTAEEHGYVTRATHGDIFVTKEAVLRYHFYPDAIKLNLLAFLINYLYAHNYKNVLSLGAGTCAFEYLLKEMLPEDSRVAAMDFDAFFIGKAKAFFPRITTIEFDFCSGDIKTVTNGLGFKPDVAIFVGSAYVMDDAQFIRLCRGIKELGIKQIIDFHAGAMDWEDVLKQYVKDFLSRVQGLAKLLGLSSNNHYLGKFHGFSRSFGEIRKLYKKAGLNLIKELSIESYKYIGICNC